MAQTTIIDETVDQFNYSTGEVTSKKRHVVKKRKLEKTDEFVKVSKYLNLIFAYNNIPLNLVPISLLFAQRMTFKTNVLYLLKEDKEEIAAMLDVSTVRVNALIQDCKKYDILRATKTQGKFVVNPYLFSAGDLVETRNLQAHFDLQHDGIVVSAEQQNQLTGEVIRKTVINREAKQRKLDIPGQLSLELEGLNG